MNACLAPSAQIRRTGQTLRSGRLVLGTTQVDDPKAREKRRAAAARSGHVLAQMRRLLSHLGIPHPSPADQEAWFTVAAVQYVAIAASRPRWTLGLRRWAQRYTPDLYRSRSAAWFDSHVDEVRREGRYLSPAEIGRMLGVTREAFLACELWDVWPDGMTAAERKQLRREHRAAWQRDYNLAKGKVKRPHAQSLARTRPWDAEGVSESTWRRRQKQGGADAQRPRV